MSEVQSQSSSIEIHDAIINESWDWGKLNNAVRIPINDDKSDDETFLGRLWRYWKESSINRRLGRFKENEAKTFSKQRISKVHDILADESTKKILVKRMICSQNRDLLQDTCEVLRRKYGMQMCDLLLKYSKYLERDSRYRVSSVVALESALDFGIDEVTSSMKMLDPLENWSKRKSDISSRMMARIQNLASSISSKVNWSFLVEPGRPQTNLAAFFSEFDVLEHFFERVDLSPEEVSQKAFDINHLGKARNRRLECVDISRVKLIATKEQGKRAELSDFIHANYVCGGPLLNKFILTQAPLPQTISDFWKMIWQEKSEYIFMLCSAYDAQSLGFKESLLNNCPFYWPRHEGDVKKFGKLVIRNEKLDTTIDPLFNVTHLLLWMEDEPAERLRVQHWQWEWKDFTDFHWPYRLLLRSRQSKSPTVVHCMDGCGRSGVLVLIEIFLMQLLRGATSYENPMITSAVFLRLQRRHTIASPMQYLYAYRTVLHWMEPFIVSSYHRFVLGLMLRNTGFVAKYDLLSSAGKKSNST